MIGVKFDKPVIRKDLAPRITERNTILEECEVWCVAEIPYDKDRIHSSFIYEEMMYMEDENGAAIINIDPTDKRFAFDNEIKRLVKNKKKSENKRDRLIKDMEDSRGSAFSSYVD